LIKIWDTQTQALLGQIEHHTNTVSCLTLTSDEKYLISGSWDQDICYWD
jgi:WD domain, G-beta repeat.